MKLLSRLILVLLAASFGAWVPPAISITSIGQQAYYNSIARFWYGNTTNGFVTNLAQSAVFGNPSGVPLPLVAGELWQYAQMVNLIYGYWKITGSADAASRVTAQWNYVKVTWTTSQLTSCGVGNPAAASDDAAWMIGLYLEAYEVTADATALTDAKALLDCAWTRWQDAALGGGLWYDDNFDKKTSYQAAYALDSLWYYQLAADSTYLTRAESIDTWMAATLQRSGQTVFGQAFPNDGMYWVTITSGQSISGFNTPYQIAQTSSVVLQVGDMAMAVLDARLYSITGTPSYLTRVNQVAVGFQNYETVSGGVALDARDARTNGWAAVFYAREVVPILTSSGAFGSASMKATAVAVNANARNSDLTYAGCWNGAASNSSCVWATNNNLYSQQVEVSANAAIWGVAALALP